MQGATWAILPTLIGFALGQVVNLFALLWRLRTRPRLRIQRIGDSHVLRKHEEQVGPGEFQEQIIYGFKIRNCGRRVARGVRAYLLKTELRYKGKAFGQVSAHPYPLPWHAPQSNDEGAVLFPHETVTVELAFWQEDLSAVVPASGWEDYCEFCGEAVQFRFTVAVVEDGGWRPARQRFVIDNPWPEEASLPDEFWSEVERETAEPAQPDATHH